MTLTVLFDLDDTLLQNDMGIFEKAYTKALAHHLSPFVSPEIMVKWLSAAIQAMLSKNSPVHTMEETFDTVFYPGIGISKADLSDTIRSFYENVFPTLRQITTIQPESQALVDYAFSKGWKVVVATNPLFPQTAIYQRLAWAGLPTHQYPFDLVTVYENSHFCKPNPAYFTEILARLRWPESPVVMVGNSWEDDIQPAEMLGIPTFMVGNRPEDPSFPTTPFSKSGSFDQIRSWLDQIEQAEYCPDFDQPISIISSLKSTPAALIEFGKNNQQGSWTIQPKPGEWSFTEIVCHLRDVDQEVNLPRIESVNTGMNPFIAGTDTDQWAITRNYLAENGKCAMDEFTNIRTTILNKLEAFTEQDWQKPARHAIFGPTTLRELIGIIATHDRNHVRQGWNAIHPS